MSFLYSSSFIADTNEGIPLTVGSTVCFSIVHLPLRSSWSATWLALTRHKGFVEGGSLDSFLISLPCLATVVRQISRRDDLLSFTTFLFFHCVDQHCSSLQCTFAKRVAWILFLVCFIEALGLLRETRYVVLSISSWNVSFGHHT